MVIAPHAREASVQISLQFDRNRTVDSARRTGMNDPVDVLIIGAGASGAAVA
jgi:hypothetical protein